MRPRKDRTIAIRGKTPAPTGEPLVQLIPIDKVTPPSENRDDLGDMEQLIASVKARGVSQAILVRPNEDGTYQIVFGERWRRPSGRGFGWASGSGQPGSASPRRQSPSTSRCWPSTPSSQPSSKPTTPVR